jgi:hypothetical protein
MGIADALIHPCFRDPDFTARVGQPRAAGDLHVGSMFSSDGWQQLNTAVGGALSERNPDGYPVPFKTMGIELGVDWGQMLVFSLRSTGLVMAR